MLSSMQGPETTPEALRAPIAVHCAECGKNLRVKVALAGKRIKCPGCGEGLRVPEPSPAGAAPAPVPARRLSILAIILLVAAILACAIYANLSFAVTDPVSYKYFPPFKQYVNANHNQHLGAEYFNIAKAMVAGEGFANPFGEKTGPTAWMPPVLPTILAGLLWACDGNRDVVMAVFIFLQIYTLVASALLVLLLARQTTNRVGTWMAAGVFFLGVIGDFHFWFQFTHDCWLVLLAMDFLIVGFCWFAPLGSKKAAVVWGLCGGVFALVNPIVAFLWGILTLLLAARNLSWPAVKSALAHPIAGMRKLPAAVRCVRTWPPIVVALLVAGLTLTPWIVRNYLVFGRLIPVKSNLVYELYQSQVLLPDGLLQPKAFAVHPYSSAGRERQLYKQKGEMVFLDEKRDLFWKSVAADPLDFADRVASRFLGATLWYVPFNQAEERNRPFVFWASRLTHPLPFLALLVLAFSTAWQPLRWSQWTVMGVYLLYLLPYIVVSYYERYAMPLLAVKMLLVIWAADRLLCLVFGKREVAGTQTTLGAPA